MVRRAAICKIIRKFAHGMNTDKIKNDELHEVLTAYLLRTRRRRTPERYMVLDCIAADGGHFSADSLYSRLAESGRRVSLGTVYNTIELLVDCGLVVEHSFGEGGRVFELAPTGHYHLVCTSCGKIKEVSDAELENLIAGRHYASFTPRRFSLSVFGVCSRCARRAKNLKKDAAASSGKKSPDKTSTSKRK